MNKRNSNTTTKSSLHLKTPSSLFAPRLEIARAKKYETSLKPCELLHPPNLNLHLYAQIILNYEAVPLVLSVILLNKSQKNRQKSC